MVIYGFWELLGGFENVIENILAASHGDEQTSSLSFFVDGIPAVVTGILVFFFADGIVRLAYRHPSA